MVTVVVYRLPIKQAYDVAKSIINDGPIIAYKTLTEASKDMLITETVHCKDLCVIELLF